MKYKNDPILTALQSVLGDLYMRIEGKEDGPYELRNNLLLLRLRDDLDVTPVLQAMEDENADPDAVRMTRNADLLGESSTWSDNQMLSNATDEVLAYLQTVNGEDARPLGGDEGQDAYAERLQGLADQYRDAPGPLAAAAGGSPPSPSTDGGEASTPVNSGTDQTDSVPGDGVDPQYQPPESDWFGIPPDGEVWKIDGEWAVAYRSDAGGPYIYYTMDDDRFGDVFPAGVSKVRELTVDEADRLGISPGSSYLLDNTLGDNWEEGFNRGLEIQSRTSPWLEDGEVVATILAATLEGREVTTADLEGTAYFADRSQAEIQYVAFAAQATADEHEQYHLQFKDTIRNQLIEAGMRDPDDTVVNYMSQKWASGQWSDSFASRQIIALANPFSSVEKEEGLAELTEGMEFDTLGTRSRQVEQIVTEWLGPHHSRNYSAEWYKQWAGAIADDPNAENDLIEVLQQQRVALYPEYSNKNLKYSDIAGVWENQMRNIWGRTPQSQSDHAVLDKVIRSNDVNNAGQILREEGLNRGVGQVVNDMAGSALTQMGGQVVRGN